MTERKPDTLITNLKGLGPTSTKMLADINVHTLADLQEMGSVFAYRVLKHRFASVSLNMLYGLEAAVRDVHWLSLSQDDKEQLRAAATDELKIDL